MGPGQPTWGAGKQRRAAFAERRGSPTPCHAVLRCAQKKPTPPAPAVPKPVGPTALEAFLGGAGASQFIRPHAPADAYEAGAVSCEQRVVRK